MTITIGDDKAMMMHSEEWPTWPILHLKRRDPTLREGDAGFGFLADVRHAKVFRVYLKNSTGSQIKQGRLEDVLSGRAYQDYESLEALLEVWIVD